MGKRPSVCCSREENENVPLPNLILLDWNLPKIDGGEVLRRIKQHPRLLRIPVLVFSSSEADEDIHAAYDNHANGYIPKPRTGEALAEIVETIERFWIAVLWHSFRKAVHAADGCRPNSGRIIPEVT